MWNCIMYNASNGGWENQRKARKSNAKSGRTREQNLKIFYNPKKLK